VVFNVILNAEVKVECDCIGYSRAIIKGIKEEVSKSKQTAQTNHQVMRYSSSNTSVSSASVVPY